MRQSILALLLLSCGGATPQQTVTVPPVATASASTEVTSAPTTSATSAPTATSAQATNRPTSLKGTSIRFEGGDGSSPANAIIIRGAQGEMDGVASEYQYLEVLHGPRGKAWKVNQQSLMEHHGRHLDALKVDYPDGRTETVYFDITDYFGKF